jgi:hypothetical protein
MVTKGIGVGVIKAVGGIITAVGGIYWNGVGCSGLSDVKVRKGVKLG